MWNIHGHKDMCGDNKLISSEFQDLYVNKYDVIGLVETWTKQDSTIGMPGYKAFHSFRKNHARGGVIVYVKNQIYQGIKRIPSISEDVIWLRLDKHFFGLPKHIYLCTAYIVPSNSSLYSHHKFNSTLKTIADEIENLSNYGNVIIQGDLNAYTKTVADFITQDQCDTHIPSLNGYTPDIECYSRRNSDNKTPNEHGKELLKLCIQANLRITNGRVLGDLTGKCTSHQRGGQALVDYILVHESLLPTVHFMKVHDLNLTSDHCQLSLILKAKYTYETTTTVTGESFVSKRFRWDEQSKAKFVETFHTMDIQLDLQQFMETNFSDQQEVAVEQFNNIMLKTAVMCLKSKSRRNINNKNTTRVKKKKWYDNTCSDLRKQLRASLNMLHKFPTDSTTRGRYYNLRKQYKKLCKYKKREHRDQIVNNLQELQDTNPKAFWDLIGKLKDEVDLDPTIIASQTEWQKYFKSLAQSQEQATFDNTFKETLETDLKDKEKLAQNHVDLDKPINIEEITVALSALKNGKSEGLDGIKNEMLLCVKSEITPALCKLMNSCLQNGSYPKSWSEGFIVPIPKVNNPQSPNDFRGITIASALGKVYSTVILNRLETVLTPKTKPNPFQAGFRKGYRSADNMCILRNIVDRVINNKKCLYTCFVDFRKAFDTIWREGLFYKLLDAGITGNCYKVIKGMLDSNTARVKTQNSFTEKFKTEVGVMQGNTLSPLLFNLFIDSIPAELLKHNIQPPCIGNTAIPCLAYADDLVLFSTTQQGLQESLNALTSYANQWRLVINTEKTKILIFNKSGKLIRSSTFKLCGTEIDQVCKYTYLGIVFSASGTFSYATEQLRCKALKAHFKVKKLLSQTNNEIVSLHEKLVDVLIKPILLYGSEIWCGTATTIKPIEAIHTQFCKNLLGVHKSTSTSAVLGELGRMPIQTDAEFNVIKYWLHIYHTTNNNLLRDVMLDIKSQPVQSKSWSKSVLSILDKYGFSYVFHNPTAVNPKSFLPQLRQRMSDCSRQVWQTQIRENDKLAVYRQVKTQFQREPYMDVLPTQQRKIFSKLRMSTHCLAIERGRHSTPKTPRHLRVCKFCHSNQIEDEEHFILSCSKYANERQSFLTQLSKLLKCSVKELKLQNLVTILGSKNSSIISTTATFLHSIYRIRLAL
jgi:exonuclease III